MEKIDYSDNTQKLANILGTPLTIQHRINTYNDIHFIKEKTFKMKLFSSKHWVRPLLVELKYSRVTASGGWVFLRGYTGKHAVMDIIVMARGEVSTVVIMTPYTLNSDCMMELEDVTKYKHTYWAQVLKGKAYSIYQLSPDELWNKVTTI